MHQIPPRDDDPTTPEWSSMQLPNKVRVILEAWRYVIALDVLYNTV